MKYAVAIAEVWTRTVTVEAFTIEEALQRANEVIESGNSPEDLFEYSHTLDRDYWYVDLLEGDK